MNHNNGLRKLGRTSSHRRALLRSLTTSLFRHERIRTTLPKAKELRPFAERLITLARRDDLDARRQVLRHVADKTAVKKLFDTLAPRFASRPGGYTRALKLGPRRGDGADLAIVELIGSEPVFTKQKEERKARRDRKVEAKKAAEVTEREPGKAAAASEETGAPQKGKRKA